jgi:hypothetical protein
MGGNSGMRAVARRDPNFRGIDPDALGELIKQVKDASTAITGWLNAHRPPPGVPTGGYRQAEQAEQWATEQLGMLARRRNYAITHAGRGGGVRPPALPPRRHGTRGGDAQAHVRRTGPGVDGAGHGGGSDGAPEPRTTPAGAGKELGNYPTRQAAVKAARADAAAFERVAEGHGPVSADAWRRLRADAADPDYTEAFYARLGPAGTAGLIALAVREQDGEAARLKAVEESLGTASHHVAMGETWLRELLAGAGRSGHRAEVVRILDAADLSARTDRVLARVGLLHAAPGDAPGAETGRRPDGEGASAPWRAG